jgi:hypothetical protein
MRGFDLLAPAKAFIFRLRDSIFIVAKLALQAG